MGCNEWRLPNVLFNWLSTVGHPVTQKGVLNRWGLVSSNTSCWGGGPKAPPPEISQTTGPIFKFQTPFDSPVSELPVQGQIFDLDVTDDVIGQVKVKIFDFSGLVTSASKTSMLSANKANESEWIVSLTSFPALYDHNTGQGHLRSPDKKGQKEKCLYLTCFMSYLSHFWRYRLEMLYTYSSDIAL